MINNSRRAANRDTHRVLICVAAVGVGLACGAGYSLNETNTTVKSPNHRL